MSKIVFYALAVIVFVANIPKASAQVPQGIPYQAVARNSAGAVLASTSVSVRFSIRDSIATGAIKYRETHAVTTSAQGMFSVNLGQGTSAIGTFSGINWGTNAKFLQVELDPAGGSSYIDMGTTQMMSVPYALYAKTAQTSTNCFTHYVGEIWGGGIVYNLYRGTDGIEHGLIVATTDFGYNNWSNVSSVLVGATAQSSWNGMANSLAIVSQAGHSSSAAKLCLEYEVGEYTGWYLPSIDELRKLATVHFEVNRALSTVSGSGILTQTGNYWSSTEIITSEEANQFSIAYDFGESKVIDMDKGSYCKVRAIRSF